MCLSSDWALHNSKILRCVRLYSEPALRIRLRLHPVLLKSIEVRTDDQSVHWIPITPTVGGLTTLSPTTYPAAVFSCEKWFGSVLRRHSTYSTNFNVWSVTRVLGNTLLIWKGPLRSWSVEVLRSEVCVAQMRCHSSLWLSTYLGLFSDKGNICLCHRLQKSTTRSLQYWYWHN